MSETVNTDDDGIIDDDFHDDPDVEREALDAFVTTPPAPVKRGVG